MQAFNRPFKFCIICGSSVSTFSNFRDNSMSCDGKVVVCGRRRLLVAAATLFVFACPLEREYGKDVN